MLFSLSRLNHHAQHMKENRPDDFHLFDLQKGSSLTNLHIRTIKSHLMYHKIFLLVSSQYQEKSITPVDHYVCTLSEASKKKAFEELNETEELRQSSIKEIRDWMLKNKRIEKARFDSRFILRFLRRQAYNIKCAKEAIERYLIFREGRYDKGDWLSNLDCNRPNLKELLNAGVLVVLPNSTAKGERVVISKFSACKNYIQSQSHGKNENSVLTSLCLGSQIFEILWEGMKNIFKNF